mmetsp:Transcript_70647/g.190247  ORF Transcript_70647/g.190247 Transcript_70647/m.190247 type:complete len:120 (+) Transcript_70647:59-418(+)
MHSVHQKRRRHGLVSCPFRAFAAAAAAAAAAAVSVAAATGSVKRVGFSLPRDAARSKEVHRPGRRSVIATLPCAVGVLSARPGAWRAVAIEGGQLCRLLPCLGLYHTISWGGLWLGGHR